MPFEKFKGTSFSRGSKIYPTVTIRKSKVIAFNSAATKKFKILDYKYSIIYFDKDGNKIGFRLTDDSTEEGLHQIRKQAQSESVYISAHSFLDFYKIQTDTSRTYNLYKDKENEMLLIDL